MCLQEAGAESVASLVLLDKKARRKVDFVPDYIGFEVRGGGGRGGERGGRKKGRGRGQRMVGAGSGKEG